MLSFMECIYKLFGANFENLGAEMQEYETPLNNYTLCSADDQIIMAREYDCEYII